MTGACPTDIIPIFFGGRLLALNKKSGGIRPIAVGLTLKIITVHEKALPAYHYNYKK